jgi:predicted protein tyrosine phosphatase
MPRILVCPLSHIDDVIAARGASHLISLLGPDYMIPPHRAIATANHLRVEVHDIAEMLPGQLAPQRRHAEHVLAFGGRWDRAKPLVIHCWAGISRSTASMFMILCKLNPSVPEIDILREMRRLAPHIAPNRLLVAHADDLLGRDGRMVDAVDLIGPAVAASEGYPFDLPADLDLLVRQAT